MIRTELRESVWQITLDRPEQRNALTVEMGTDLRRALENVPHAACAVLLRGEGRVFCAGFDLLACQESTDGTTVARLLEDLCGGIAAMRASRVPVLVAAQGGAIAGGCALLTAADWVVADANAMFGYPVLRLGLSPAVSLPTLGDCIGWGAARVRGLDTQLIPAARALAIGLVDQIEPDATGAQVAAWAAATRMAGRPGQAIEATRSLLMKSIGAIDEATLEGALATSLESARTVEHRTMLGKALDRHRS